MVGIRSARASLPTPRHAVNHLVDPILKDDLRGADSNALSRPIYECTAWSFCCLVGQRGEAFNWRREALPA
jgi:hypothetical protein